MATFAERIFRGSLSGGFATAAATVVGLAAVMGVNGILNNYSLGNPLLGGANTRDWPETMWEKEFVLITGGSTGIGLAMVKMFAARGIRVVVLGRSAPAVAAGEGGERVVFYAVDLADGAALEAAAARVRQEVGDPAVVINNAGVSRALTLLESTRAQIEELFAVNAVAPVLVTRAFLPAMVAADRGHVVVVASMASFVAVAGMVDYGATKAALLAFYEGLRQELAHRYGAGRVRTTIVHPFWVATPMLAGMTAGKRFAGERTLTAEQVAALVVRQVLRGRSGALVVPWHMGVLASARALPVWLQERLRAWKAPALTPV